MFMSSYRRDRRQGAPTSGAVVSAMAHQREIGGSKDKECHERQGLGVASNIAWLARRGHPSQLTFLRKLLAGMHSHFK